MTLRKKSPINKADPEEQLAGRDPRKTFSIIGEGNTGDPSKTKECREE